MSLVPRDVERQDVKDSSQSRLRVAFQTPHVPIPPVSLLGPRQNQRRHHPSNETIFAAGEK